MLNVFKQISSISWFLYNDDNSILYKKIKLDADPSAVIAFPNIKNSINNSITINKQNLTDYFHPLHSKNCYSEVPRNNKYHFRSLTIPSKINSFSCRDYKANIAANTNNNQISISQSLISVKLDFIVHYIKDKEQIKSKFSKFCAEHRINIQKISSEQEVKSFNQLESYIFSLEKFWVWLLFYLVDNMMITFPQCIILLRICESYIRKIGYVIKVLFSMNPYFYLKNWSVQGMFGKKEMLLYCWNNCIEYKNNKYNSKEEIVAKILHGNKTEITRNLYQPDNTAVTMFNPFAPSQPSWSRGKGDYFKLNGKSKRIRDLKHVNLKSGINDIKINIEGNENTINTSDIVGTKL